MTEHSSPHQQAPGDTWTSYAEASQAERQGRRGVQRELAGVGEAYSAADTYLDRVRATPGPSTFGNIWTEWQFPPNASIPLYNMGRPFAARDS
ncbi:hypothetical protein WJX84_006656 [Apatococcus fuscideae]|uniref:Uncharacterized protein n=1 Tax=Apatococcus fuscideae TaxID=2026836 RepID=A0AAW1SQP8_9CHLO